MSVTIDYTKGFVEGSLLAEGVGTLSGTTLDLTSGNVFSHAPGAAATYVFSNPPTTGTAVDEETGETYETGRWVIGYTVVNKPQDKAEDAVRNQRNRLLQDTDWMALSDNTMSEAVTTYCQALRDVPDQDGFPFDVVWPTKP